ncbi:MAG TPA: hypothetical protein VIY29_29685 [Ktedonobacteraceae bacterium]
MYQQQESSHEGTSRDEQKSSYGAYESFSSTRDDEASTDGQKLHIGIPASSQGPSWEYRLGMIVISLIFWMGFFFTVIGFILSGVSVYVEVLLLMGLVVFTLMLIGASLLFFFHKR